MGKPSLPRLCRHLDLKLSSAAARPGIGGTLGATGGLAGLKTRTTLRSFQIEFLFFVVRTFRCAISGQQAPLSVWRV